MMYFDSYQLVVHHDSDSGDSCADTFRYWYARYLNGSTNSSGVRNAYDVLFSAGVGRRSPYKWTDIKDFSRDQTRPAVICLQAFGFSEQVTMIRRITEINDWRYQNGEFSFPDHRAEFDPANRNMLADICQLLASIFLVVHSWIDWNMCSDDQNHVMGLIQFRLSKNTLLNKLACKIYCFRKNGPIWALRTYYAVDNPEIGAMMAIPVQTIIMGKPQQDENAASA